MISRRTIFTLLLALLVPLGIHAWVVQHRDPCDELLGVHNTPTRSVYVESGTRTIEVPCDEWLTRQPAGVQIVCLLEVVLCALFFLCVLIDWRRWQARRQSRPDYQGSV